jgi:hypothetical protein
MPSMPDLTEAEMAALRFMMDKPLSINPFSLVPNVEGVADMLDELARRGLCQRTLEGINRVYSITRKGVEAVSKRSA